MGETMDEQSPPIFFDYHNIFAEQYVLEYDRLRKQYPFWSYKMVLIKAKESTIEYLYQLLKSELKVKPVWPKEFIRPEGGS